MVIAGFLGVSSDGLDYDRPRRPDRPVAELSPLLLRVLAGNDRLEKCDQGQAVGPLLLAQQTGDVVHDLAEIGPGGRPGGDLVGCDGAGVVVCGPESLWNEGRRIANSLSPIQGMPLNWLVIGGGDRAGSMPLTNLHLRSCRPVQDLSPLKGMSLTSLTLYDCKQVRDLSPLKGMPLTNLSLAGCDQVRDLSWLGRPHRRPGEPASRDHRRSHLEKSSHRYRHRIAAIHSRDEVSGTMRIRPGSDRKRGHRPHRYAQALGCPDRLGDERTLNPPARRSLAAEIGRAAVITGKGH